MDSLHHVTTENGQLLDCVVIEPPRTSMNEALVQLLANRVSPGFVRWEKRFVVQLVKMLTAASSWVAVSLVTSSNGMSGMAVTVIPPLPSWFRLLRSQ